MAVVCAPWFLLGFIDSAERYERRYSPPEYFKECSMLKFFRIASVLEGVSYASYFVCHAWPY